MTHRSARACLVGLLAVTTACGGRAAQGPTSPSVRPSVIAVLGDSLSVSPSPNESFPAVLQRRLEAEGHGWRVVSFGQNGDTTADGLARLDHVLAEQPDILVLALGANDGIRGVPLDTVRQNLETIITRAQAAGVRVLLCGMEAPPLNGLRYSLAFHFLFPDLAEKYDLPLVPFLLTGVIGRRELNREDWVHPNARGAERIAETIWPVLEPMLTETGVARLPDANRESGIGDREDWIGDQRR
jgi:acyl-CoA thioesterase I